MHEGTCEADSDSDSLFTAFRPQARTSVQICIKVSNKNANTIIYNFNIPKQGVKFDEVFEWTRVHWDNKPWQIGLNHDYNKAFSISTREWQYSPLEIRIWCSKREPFHVLLPLLRHVVPLNNGNCRLTMRQGTLRSWRATPYLDNIAVFKSVKIILLQ